jgi:hypothetical protein
VQSSVEGCIPAFNLDMHSAKAGNEDWSWLICLVDEKSDWVNDGSAFQAQI